MSPATFVRAAIQKGATQIKIMASGGVAWPVDPISNMQYSEEEIRAIVGEAEAANTYVMAHAYTARAIARAVRTIEHGNLVDEAAAALMHEHGAFVVPPLVTYDALAQLDVLYNAKYNDRRSGCLPFCPVICCYGTSAIRPLTAKF